MKTFWLDGTDGKKLYCRLWDDVENPKAAVQIVHGMGEYAGGYAPFAEFLNANGYIAFADDHRAHGLTETDADRGHADGDVFQDTVSDELIVLDYLKKRYDLPVLYFGHSYGSFLGQAFLERNPDVAGVILAGSGMLSPLATGAGMFACRCLMALFGGKMRTGFLEPLDRLRDRCMYRGKEDRGPGLWLTRDPERRRAHIEDRYNSVPMSVSFCYYILKGIRDSERKSEMAKVSRDVPLGVFSGSRDPIGGCGRTVKKLVCAYGRHGVKTHLILYEGARHDLLNETNRDEVMKDVLAFFEDAVRKWRARE